MGGKDLGDMISGCGRVWIFLRTWLPNFVNQDR